MTFDEAKKLLDASELLFDRDDDDPPDAPRVLNLNDAFFWACADGEEVPEDCFIELADLFWRYGNCGVMYWVWKRRGGFRPEFRDIRRFIEFVDHEEQLRVTEPDSNKRAYVPLTYTVGADQGK